MKRKIIGIVIVTLLISAALPLVSSTEKIDSDSVSNERYVDEAIRCTTSYKPGFFPKTEIYASLNPIEDTPRPIIIGDLPDHFSWRDYEGQDWTTPAKCQFLPKSCGSCWAFAALGALESVINIREGIPDLDPDLSEQYVLSCLPNAGSCEGGREDWAFKFILENDSRGNNCNGIIPEICFPYQADDAVPCESKWSNWEEFLIPILDYGKIQRPILKMEEAKSEIMQRGPVYATMFANDNFSRWGWTHHSPDDYFPFEHITNINHCVVIVGWKDDPSIGKGGYWVCKNSWGESFGYDGFFNLEYESIYIGWGYFTWVDYDPDRYDWHPVPKAHGPYFGLVDDPVQFQGVAAGEHPPFTYHWDFGDDTTSEEQNPSHTYITPGEYTVTLTATDDNDDSFPDETYAWVQVTNQPPTTPHIEGPTKVKAGENCTYNLTFPDPDGSMVYIYVEAFNESSNIWWGPYLPGNEKQTLQLQPEEEGEYTVKVKAKDPYGAESDWAVLEVSVPKNKTTSTQFQQFLEQHPHLFPILRHLLGL